MAVQCLDAGCHECDWSPVAKASLQGMSAANGRLEPQINASMYQLPTRNFPFLVCYRIAFTAARGMSASVEHEGARRPTWP